MVKRKLTMRQKASLLDKLTNVWGYAGKSCRCCAYTWFKGNNREWIPEEDRTYTSLRFEVKECPQCAKRRSVSIKYIRLLVESIRNYHEELGINKNQWKSVRVALANILKASRARTFYKEFPIDS